MPPHITPGRRNAARSRRLTDEWRLQLLQQELEEAQVDRERLKKDFDQKYVVHLTRALITSMLFIVGL